VGKTTAAYFLHVVEKRPTGSLSIWSSSRFARTRLTRSLTTSSLDCAADFSSSSVAIRQHAALNSSPTLDGISRGSVLRKSPFFEPTGSSHSTRCRRRPSSFARRTARAVWATISFCVAGIGHTSSCFPCTWAPTRASAFGTACAAPRGRAGPAPPRPVAGGGPPPARRPLRRRPAAAAAAAAVRADPGPGPAGVPPRCAAGAAARPAGVPGRGVAIPGQFVCAFVRLQANSRPSGTPVGWPASRLAPQASALRTLRSRPRQRRTWHSGRP